MVNKFLNVLLFSLLLVAGIKVSAQKTQVYENPLQVYNRAHELFQHEQYGEAQKHFLIYTKQASDRETKINAQYYAGVCAMELFNPDAINLLLDVNLKYPEHSKAKPALFQLGKYFYRVKDNKAAIKYFEQVSAQDLTADDADEYYFLKGYCYFKTEKFDESKNSFVNIKDKQSKYYDAANYYYGYVVYRQSNYDEALTHFLRIKQSKTFGPLSQVYVAQIYFSRKQYAEVIEFAGGITDKEVTDDVAGMVGQSYFHLGDYAKALPYLERFNANPPVAKTNQDVYRLGYAYLRTDNYAKAIEQLSSIATEKDSTAQFANYHLAEAYLKSDRKQPARLAFDLAHKLGFNTEVTELALYNYAKLSAELSFQQDALKDFVKFVNTYPNSKYIDAARTELSSLLLSTKNYKDAVTLIESIKNPNRDNKEAYQRVCYYRAEELYLNNDYAAAEEMFRKSQQYDFDKRLYALSWFWLGELSYKNNNYETAFKHYHTFSNYQEIKDTRFYSLAFYNRGYCMLKQENYQACIDEMKKFTATDYAKNNPELFTDGTMRIADCYFVLHEYNTAIENYDIIITQKLNGADYALYQKAMILGVLNKPTEKTEALRNIVNNFKRSTYIDDALFEIANVQLQTEQYEEAAKGFNTIIENYPRSTYIRKSLLNKGLAQYNQSKDEEALATFKKLITDYSTSPEAKEALVVIKNIFINKGESDEYLAFIRVLPNVTVSPSYQDSVTYESAFIAYKNGDCNKASKSMGNYINRFPGGFFILRANYYKAECDFKAKNYDSALICYEYVAAQNRNDYTERAVRQSAIIHFTKNNYEKAYDYYASLERIASSRDNLGIALLGQMKSAAALRKTDSAAQASFKYLNSTIAQKEGTIEAKFNIARYYMLHNQPDSALTEFQYVLKETKNAMAAESKYNIAYIRFLKKDYKAARKHVFEIADNYSSYEYWVAKSYLLLADIYIVEKDNFQAKATLQSLVENYEGEDLKNIAIEKLRAIIAEEDKQKELEKKPATEKEIEKL